MFENGIYRSSLALLTDMYQLTMAFGYWRLGIHDRLASFNLFFRRPPFAGGYTIAAGLEDALTFLEKLRFNDDDLAYLESLRGADGNALFNGDFIRFLQQFKFDCDVHAVPEGTVVFPHEPILRVTGPVLACQLVETALLNIVNYQTLVATKAARVCYSAQGDSVVEFGLRRAHGIDGGLSASRAAFIGGCSATSNLLAGKTYGIPVSGTHAHSWVMCFENELDAFTEYANTMPGNCVLLVDTYDSLRGVKHAIEVGKKLELQGKQLLGIRLDSGDLAYLSIEARRLLDEAGFTNTQIIASNDLDEVIIDSLKRQGAKINIWGVGTKLVTSYDQPALGGVYKLSLIQNERGQWLPKLKLSEQAVKISTPGLLQVRRFSDDKGAVADMIFDELTPPPAGATIIDPLDPTRRRRLTEDLKSEDLLQKVMESGQRVANTMSLHQIQVNTKNQLENFHDGIKRLVHPHRYPVGLEQNLYEAKTRLILKQRGFSE
ncbi:MAG TPA: nicotinate phosphoribosyltransferase [Pirellulaceae bacterium]|nr:nicotinate phosphoribosyltransferase [Pirellulaceae bacterium]HMO90563.1 nicotinate phosphoribosyltransferase [Pirellulaceae bacterium]HMP71218.1 nicotinate phosphoribosyltransferase [Pirellulaceae bacterium]